MPINIRQKGAEGERQVATALNAVVAEVAIASGLPIPVKPSFQRNQNQSAVGGSDLTNPFKLCIEVKRQEQLSVNTWWKQCLIAQRDFGGIAILIFKQNREKWRVIMFTKCELTGLQLRSEITWECFLEWFAVYLKLEIQRGNWNVV